MDVFGHVGLTLAAAYLGERLVAHRLADRRMPTPAHAKAKAATASGTAVEGSRHRRFSLDYRLVFLGSMIPDLLDKPLGLWLTPDLVNNSLRSIGHSAVFIAVLLAMFAIAPGFRTTHRIVAIGAGSFGHLVLDQMWRQPVTVMWPLLGASFPSGTSGFAHWSASHVRGLLTFYNEPPELLGAAAILLFAVMLMRPHALGRFLRSGAIA